MQCLPGYADSTGFCSIHRVQFVLQYSPSTVCSAVFTEYSSEYIFHRVQFRMQWLPSNNSEQCQPSEFPLPSLQWLPSSELLKAVSMNRVFTSTESMTMPCNIVDTEYQKVTELVQWTRVVYCWAGFVKDFHLCYWPTLLWFYNLKDIYIMYVLCKECDSGSESEK